MIHKWISYMIAQCQMDSWGSSSDRFQNVFNIDWVGVASSCMKLDLTNYVTGQLIVLGYFPDTTSQETQPGFVVAYQPVTESRDLDCVNLTSNIRF